MMPQEPTENESRATNQAERRARLTAIKERMGDLYDRFMLHSTKTDLIDAMQCGHMLREILDGCLAEAGHETYLVQYQNRWRRLRAGVDRFLDEIEGARIQDDASFRDVVEQSKAALFRETERKSTTTKDQFIDVVRRLGVEDEAQREPLAELAISARDAASRVLHYQKDASPEEIIDLASNAAQQLNTLLDLVDPAFAPRHTMVEEFLAEAQNGKPLQGNAAKQLMAALSDNDAARTFFTQLDNPDWIEPLLGAGALAKRDHLQQSDDGTLTERTWWAGQFLIRMADQAPAQVVDALLKEAGDETSQTARIWRMVATRLPADEYTQIEQRLRADLERAVRVGADGWPGHGYEVAELVEHLGEIGLPRSIGALVRPLLQPAPSEENQEEDILRRVAWHKARSAAGLDYHATSHLLKAAGKAMAGHADRALFDTLLFAVDTHLRQEYPGDGREEGTWVGRRDWDDDDGGYEDTLLVLLRALYRETKRLIEDGWDVEDLCGRLWNREWSGVRRLALKIRANRLPEGLERARDLILDADLFIQRAVQRDYVGLVEAAAPHLDEDAKQAYCEMVAQTFEPTETREKLERYLDEASTEDVVEREVRKWRRNRLHPMAGHLPPEWQAYYDAAVADFGEAEFVYGPIESTGGGFVRPSKDFEGLDRAAVLKKLRGSETEAEHPGFFDDIFSGLSDHLIAHAGEMLDPDFVRAMPGRWASGVAYAVSRAVQGGGLDPGMAVACVEALLQAHAPYMQEFALSGVRALEDASKDPSTPATSMTTAIEALGLIGTSVDPPSLENPWDTADVSLNAARSHALEALIDIQVRAHGDEAVHMDSFDQAKDTMNRVIHAWPKDNPMASGIIGQRFVSLWVLDRQWLYDHDDLWRFGKAQHADVAWASYITWNRIYGDVTDELIADYHHALETAVYPDADQSSRLGYDYQDRLTDHLLVLWYWNKGGDRFHDLIVDLPPHLLERLVFNVYVLLKNSEPGDHDEVADRIGILLDRVSARVEGDDRLQGCGRPLSLIIADTRHFDPEKRIVWLQRLTAQPASLDIDDDLLNALLPYVEAIPGSISQVLPVLAERVPSYELRDVEDALGECFRWFIQHPTEGDTEALLAAADHLGRRGLKQFPQLYTQLRESRQG